jgi:hypothetical protein
MQNELNFRLILRHNFQCIHACDKGSPQNSAGLISAQGELLDKTLHLTALLGWQSHCT